MRKVRLQTGKKIETKASKNRGEIINNWRKQEEKGKKIPRQTKTESGRMRKNKRSRNHESENDMMKKNEIKI